MKHRGRHRRRRRGRALRAFLTGTALALTAAATMISASQATVDDDPGALRPLAADGIAPLAEDLVPARALDRLTHRMGRPVSVGTLLSTARRALRPAAECGDAARAALPLAPAATRAHCWTDDDARGWRAGAVTTSADADDDGAWGAHRVVLAGASDGRRLARVSFVDAAAATRPAYASALLVVPVRAGRDYRPLASDLSGMVWYQDKLLVTAEDALYVYDLRRLLRATMNGPEVGRVREGWSAHGLPYVLPAVGAYRFSPGGPRLAALSLDRSTAPDSLVAAERTDDGAGSRDQRAGTAGTRLWRYSFSTDPARHGLLATDSDGVAAPREAFRTEADDVRGVLSYRSGWYVSRAGDDGPGSLWRQDTEGARVVGCGPDRTPHCWSTSTPSLSYAERTGEVWAQSGRVLFALPLREIDRALGWGP